MPTAAPLRPQQPPGIRLADVAVRAGIPEADLPAAWAGVPVTGVTLDSRTVQHGDLYAALPGSAAHGADFARPALQAGACAVLTDPEGAARLRAARLRAAAGAVGTAAQTEGTGGIPLLVVPDPRAVLGRVAAAVYGDAGRDLVLLGITGTNGKTTTAYLLDAALRALGRTTGLVGTVETRIAGERRPSVRTTPESTDVHALLAVMRERGVEVATMEVSSHALALHRVDGVVYDVAAFTNLSQDHLDFHGSMERYFEAKAELFTPAHSRRGVVCVDDPWGRRLAAGSGVPVLTVASSAEAGADWWLDAAPGKPAFTLRPRVTREPDPELGSEPEPGLGSEPEPGLGSGRGLRLRSALPGDFNRVNTALAAVMLLSCGIPEQDVERALRADPEVPGRMERVDRGGSGQPRAVVDFAHTADAIAAALDALRPDTPGRLVVVLGAGGDRDRGKRPHMGRAAAEHADAVVVTDDNPRSEDPAAIRAEILAGAAPGRTPGSLQAGSGPGMVTALQVLEVAGRAEAIRRAVALTRGPQDTVVVVGKGHESGQEVAGVVHPFDDRAELRAALAELPGLRELQRQRTEGREQAREQARAGSGAEGRSR